MDIIWGRNLIAVPPMPYNLPIPQRLLAAGWRVSLRSQGFLVPGGRWSEIPAEIKQAIEDHLKEMRAYWDARNPHNLVEGDDDENNG